MANPQIENGYTKIANEIMEALCKIRINGEAIQILFVIFRKTYGYNKKEDVISLSQFSVLTGLKRPNICRAINKLKQMNIIIQKDNDIANIYQLNKDFSTWKPLSKKITLSKKIMTVIQKDNNRYPKRYIQKKVLKDNITKEIKDIVDTVTQKDNEKVNISKFIKPLIEEIKAYCNERGNKVDPQLFYDHYESNGWFVGKNKMKDWKAAIRTWEKSKKENKYLW